MISIATIPLIYQNMNSNEIITVLNYLSYFHTDIMSEQERIYDI